MPIMNGVKYERIKCPKCGAKVLFSHERQDFCQSCGSEIIIDTTSGRKEVIFPHLGVLGIISIFGAILGGIISTIWGFVNHRILELIWIIPLGTTIGALSPFIIYIIYIVLIIVFDILH